MVRRKLDFYETGQHAVSELMKRVPLGLEIIEPCVGLGAIAKPLAASGRQVWTSDLDVTFDPTGVGRDACWWLDPSNRAHHLHRSADIVTNPPFNEANRIVPAFVRAGHRCAFLLRLSWLEPTLDGFRNNVAVPGRQDFLAEHPPSGLIVLPRYSFTGDGKTDSVTAAWMLWGFKIEPAIQVVKKPAKA
jgi:hypothetical protein